MRYLCVLLILMVAATACGADPTPRPTPSGPPLTVEEYIAYCTATEDENDEAGGEPQYDSAGLSSWGAIGAGAAYRLEDTIHLNPPAELREYHEALLAFLEGLVDRSREVSPDTDIRDTPLMHLEVEGLENAALDAARASGLMGALQAGGCFGIR